MERLLEALIKNLVMRCPGIPLVIAEVQAISACP